MEMSKPSWFPEESQAKKITYFVLWFSRWEYALKNAGYHKNAEQLEPDWDKFINELTECKAQIPASLKNEIEYLKENPVQKQLVDKSWKIINRSSDWQWLIRSVTTVRNNLFHGGKHYDGRLLEPARDERLIDTCQKIMMEILTICPQFQVYFY